MNELINKIKDDVWKHFVSEHSDILDSLHKCEHGFINKDGSITPNIHHKCGSVLVHTQMVYQEAVNLLKQNNVTDEKYIRMLLTVTLCHDFGKPWARQQHEETGKTRFFNHPRMSILVAIPVINKWFTDLEDKRILLTVIFFHDAILNKIALDKYMSKNSIDFKLLNDLAICDTRGRICDQTQEERMKIFNNLPDFEMIPCPIVPEHVKKVLFTWGIPCSGKSTIFKQDGIPYFAPDKTLEEIGRTQFNEPSYNMWFQRVRDAKIDWVGITQKDMITALETNDTVIYDATNLTEKGRKALITKVKQKFPNTTFEINCFFRDYAKIRKSNDERAKEGKLIPITVYDSMVGSLTLPSFSEGFSKINYFVSPT